jgi:hypothetical protein
MRKVACSSLVLFVVASATLLVAQPPSPAGHGGPRGGNGDVVAASVARMMTFDTDQDGKLTRSEVSDSRLVALFDRADENKDNVLTSDELTALFTREAASLRGGGPGGPGGAFGGPARGPGGPPPRGPEDVNGFGPPNRGPGGSPRPGEVLPRFLQDELQLTRRQRAQLEKLQTDVDARLANILTEEQLVRLAELRDRGPGGPGGPGGPPPRGEFGPPPDERDSPPRERPSRGRRPAPPPSDDENR